MKIVEHKESAFQWADPLPNSARLDVKQKGSDLHIRGIYPRFQTRNLPTDLIAQHRASVKSCAGDKPTRYDESPMIMFANADTDEKLINFVRQFGPVVAREAWVRQEESKSEMPDASASDKAKRAWILAQSVLPLCLFAVQDIEELRNERIIYRSTLDLISLMTSSDFEFVAAQQLIAKISAKIAYWPSQWNRERAQLMGDPLWNLSAASLKRIEYMSSCRPDGLLPPTVDGYIVIAELLNSFKETLFPNLSEMHSSIRYGIRPLLYSLVRRHIVYPRDFAVCANRQCRNFFNVDRIGRRYCSTECSIHQRQRTYWETKGKKRRKKRLKEKKKATK